jgi:hypothetical protein
MASRFTLPREQGFDANGDPLPGGKLYFYVSTTSTPLDTYSDNGLTTPNTNPVEADSAGRWGDIFLAEADYKVILTDEDDVVIWTADPVRGPAGAAEATQNEVDARTPSNVYISPRRIAEGVGLQGASIASASTLTLPAVGDYFNVTGTTTVTAISTRTAGREIELVFAGALILTHNATSLICLGGANITTMAGDIARFRSEGSGNWRMVNYQRANRFGTVCTKNPYTLSSTTTQAHGLPGVPKVRVELECLADEGGYVTGDVLDIGAAGLMERGSTSGTGVQIQVNATNVIIVIGDTLPAVINKSTAAQTTITAAKWKITAKPEINGV